MFVSRIFGWLGEGGTQAVVTPQNWLFLTSYRKLRERLLKARTWNLSARLGTKSFDTPMWDFNVMLNILSSEGPVADWEMAGVDVSSRWGQRPIKAAEKGELLRGEAGVVISKQAEQLKNPDSVVLTTPHPSHHPLSHYANSYHGISTTDYARFGRAFWELVDIGKGLDMATEHRSCHGAVWWSQECPVVGAGGPGSSMT